MEKVCTYNVITHNSCNHEQVILRVDANVPLLNGAIEDDFRLKEIVPTIDLLLKNHATILLITHLGRSSQNLSTKVLVDWLTHHGYTAFFAATPDEAHKKASEHPNSIIMLENIRLFKGETSRDPAFAQTIAKLGSCYINDAFGTMHRNETSLTLVPTLFPAKKRFIGLLVARELAALRPLKETPAKPFVVIVGGGKIADKIPLISSCIGKADTILLCPAIAFTFMKSKGLPVGSSLVDDSLLQLCSQLMDQARQAKTTIVLPSDLLVAQSSYEGALSEKLVTDLTQEDVGISLGKESTLQYLEEIKKAKTIFFNAAMGFVSRQETLIPAQKLITAIGNSSAYGVIGGGDSVALTQNLSYGPGIKHLSTGGGATLTYLSGQPLPALEALCIKE